MTTWWPSFIKPKPSAIYGCTSPREPIVLEELVRTLQMRRVKESLTEERNVLV